MLRTALLITVGAFAFGLGSNALSIAQSSSNFEKRISTTTNGRRASSLKS